MVDATSAKALENAARRKNVKPEFLLEILDIVSSDMTQLKIAQAVRATIQKEADRRLTK